MRSKSAAVDLERVWKQVVNASVSGDVLITVGWEVAMGWEVSADGARLAERWRTSSEISPGEVSSVVLAASGRAEVWAAAMEGRLLVTPWGSRWAKWERPLDRTPRGLSFDAGETRLRLVDTGGVRWFAVEDGRLLDQAEVDLSIAGDAVESAATSGDALLVGTRQGAVLHFTRSPGR